ncbi:MAG: DUF350 domain-containing protein [Candidatus Gracilibacteria bacterium]|nr:DUF350 domain-containing protein [Candidatus Gracilibacteria bacterium]
MFNLAIFIDTIVYIILGIVLFVLSIFLVSKCFKWSLHKELIEDQNIALGIMFAGGFISIAIIISAAIHG